MNGSSSEGGELQNILQAGLDKSPVRIDGPGPPVRSQVPDLDQTGPVRPF